VGRETLVRTFLSYQSIGGFELEKGLQAVEITRELDQFLFI